MGGELKPAHYLYHSEGEDDKGGPVVEYLPGEDMGVDNDIDLHPDFLYRPSSPSDYSPPPRVVEFYAPWCPHCKHYAPKYMKLAAEVTAVQPSIKFYAVSCVAHSELCKQEKVRGYPTIKYFLQGSYEKLNVTKPSALRENANNLLKELGFEGVKVGPLKAPPMPIAKLRAVKEKLKTDKQKARVIPFQMHDVQDAWTDASVSFEFALKNGIFMENGRLSREKSEAFHAWLDLLSKTLPSQMARTHDIIDAILKKFVEATGSQTKLDELVSQHVPSQPNWTWRTCTYGDNEMGYTCGLWQLFHIMSVGVVEYNRHNPPIPTRQASETLRNYIDHFFQCDVCRMNFLSMYDTCAFDGCHRLSENPSLSEQEWRELPLWLWETHNDGE